MTETPSASDTRVSTGSAVFNPDIWISEVGWAGTSASSADEWMEIGNPGGGAVNLAGWTLTDGGDIRITLSGTIGAGGFFLLERTDDTTVADIPADQIYVGALANGGETFILADPSGRIVDSIPAASGWSGGSAIGFGSMERTGMGNSWCTNDGIHRNGTDAAGQPIHGTPRQPFSGYCALTTTPSPTSTSAATHVATSFITSTLTASATNTSGETGTASPSLMPDATLTLTPTSSPTIPTPPAESIIISEVSWAGTAFSANDEWIELHNRGSGSVDLTGWTLGDGDHVQIILMGALQPGGYFLLERTSDQTISDIAADEIYLGALSNTGAILRLADPAGSIIDSAVGFPWPAGSSAPVRTSMERTDSGAWCSNDGVHRNGLDAGGTPIHGTPRQPFSGFCAPQTPTFTATRTHTQTATSTATWVMSPYPAESVILNEVAWSGTAASSSDEWMELWNPGDAYIPLNGWRITYGDRFSVPLAGSIASHGYFLLERGDDDTIRDIPADQIYDGIIGNTGLTLRLIDPSGATVDIANAAGQAWPAGSASPVYAFDGTLSDDPGRLDGE